MLYGSPCFVAGPGTWAWPNPSHEFIRRHVPPCACMHAQMTLSPPLLRVEACFHVLSLRDAHCGYIFSKLAGVCASHSSVTTCYLRRCILLCCAVVSGQCRSLKSWQQQRLGERFCTLSYFLGLSRKAVVLFCMIAKKWVLQNNVAPCIHM